MRYTFAFSGEVTVIADSEQMDNKSIVIQYCVNIPEGATNGDVIKTLFPDIDIHIENEDVVVCKWIRKKYEHFRYPISWWNAPYKIEKENEKC